jgi:hypothetical protein
MGHRQNFFETLQKSFGMLLQTFFCLGNALCVRFLTVQNRQQDVATDSVVHHVGVLCFAQHQLRLDGLRQSAADACGADQTDTSDKCADHQPDQTQTQDL